MATISNRKLQKIITLPINQVFRYFTAKEPVEIWLLDKNNTRIAGTLRGFDEYMNLVLEGAEELHFNKETQEFDKTVPLGEVMLKGENIVLIGPRAPPTPPPATVSAAPVPPPQNL
ncbi:small nuclear ribonucleoprotein E [Gregarina niphandrodes]|uniref:Small nuclear ribonucleoprotein E n=1 Tax=Gregarina niphandrodes TaxID=110365 RepID=A0A023BDE5_GRENI|nr:small nuclear ribonucleoprotein E [Gregarina niphandrodes]EZG88109.1 small nuclear ribonucleoprotein E [Gregarina niphandrodes]|eukprot:XP_011128626.1 small nuclear ribonucleoprotein E [Gregarina niphandrodes]